jgi:hypothetical protein
MLGEMELSSTDINTRGFEALLNLVENTSHDSFDLYYGLFLYNANATGGCSCIRSCPLETPDPITLLPAATGKCVSPLNADTVKPRLSLCCKGSGVVSVIASCSICRMFQ